MQISETASAILLRKLPPKMKDPGSFNINITMGEHKIDKAVLDLGASINVMPYSLYLELGLGELKPTSMTLELADGSVKYPKGIIENLLVQVEKFIVPVDFVVLDMEEGPTKDGEQSVLLGRPFMATTRTIIDVYAGKLTTTVLGETIKFNVFDVLSLPSFLSFDNCFYIKGLNLSL